MRASASSGLTLGCVAERATRPARTRRLVLAHARPAANSEHVGHSRGRDDQQRQQQQGSLEAHEPPPHTAPTCTEACAVRTAPPAWATTTTRLPRTLRFADKLLISAALGGRATSKAIECQAEIRRSLAAQATIARVVPGRMRTLRTRRMVG